MRTRSCWRSEGNVNCFIAPSLTTQFCQALMWRFSNLFSHLRQLLSCYLLSLLWSRRPLSFGCRSSGKLPCNKNVAIKAEFTMLWIPKIYKFILTWWLKLNTRQPLTRRTRTKTRADCMRRTKIPGYCTSMNGRENIEFSPDKLQSDDQEHPKVNPLRGLSRG